MKIFITVGSVLPFDPLIQEADKLLGQEVTAQIGKGKYEPKNIAWFRFRPDLTPYYEDADLVVCNNGAGTITKLIKMGKRILVVPNPDMIPNNDILDYFWCHGQIRTVTKAEDLKDGIEETVTWFSHNPPGAKTKCDCGVAEIIRGVI